MHWWLWAGAFAIVNIPILTLLADRILAVPAPKVIRTTWVAGALGLTGIILVSMTADPALLELLQWGLAGGFVATVALDLVRLFGHHVLRAFPVDMPQVFGMLALGLGPKLQEHMIAGLVARMAGMSPEVQRRMLAERITTMVSLPEPVRVTVVRAMQRGLGALPEGTRGQLLQTQMALLAEQPGESRRLVMRAMDLARTDGTAPAYAQPRGMPKVPMHLARELLATAVPRAAAEGGVPRIRLLLTGYGWHLLNGLGFGLAYTLLVGAGTWGLALAWGVAIWAGMMILMPVMMPLIRFPMPGFLVVPFVAHIVMAVPIGYYALQASPAATAASLLGLILR